MCSNTKRIRCRVAEAESGRDGNPRLGSARLIEHALEEVQPLAYLMLAGLTISLHVGFVLFVLFGGLALYRWSWVVWLHVPAVVYAILIQTIGWPCPLTDIEKWLRSLAGQQPYAGEFLPHYLWSPLGLSGTEPILAVALIAVLLAINLRPYLGWAAG